MYIFGCRGYTRMYMYYSVSSHAALYSSKNNVSKLQARMNNFHALQHKFK